MSAFAQSRADNNALSDMDYHCEKLVKPIRVLDVVTRVRELELSREWDSVKQFSVPPKIFLILESLQMKGKHIW